MKFRERYQRDLDFRGRVKKLASFLFALIFLAVCSVVRLLPRAAFSYALPARETGELRVHFLDVGQGDCTVAEFPDGSALIVDAGDGSREHNERIERYLGGLSFSSLTAVATHADSDHCGGFSAVLEKFGAEKLWLPVLPSEGSAYLGMIGAAAQKGIPTETLTRYTGATCGEGSYWTCISPRMQGEDDENDASAVLYLSHAGVGVLLCGDISAARERLLYEEYTLFAGIFDGTDRPVRLENTKILKVAHHGSDSSSSEEWLSLLGAETAVVSCGRGNRYFHPAGGAAERLLTSGARIYRTDELGCIMVTVSVDGTCRTEWGYLR